MNLRLERRLYREDGIFSDLKDEKGNLIAVTLEHAYDNGSGGWTAKVKPGTFYCQRGQHRLHNMTFDFVTFEVLGIAGHDDILFHWGNFNKDSEGCILVGKTIAYVNGAKMITRSKDAFADFMKLETDTDLFQLTVIA